jgi:hypothetical protein
MSAGRGNTLKLQKSYRKSTTLATAKQCYAGPMTCNHQSYASLCAAYIPCVLHPQVMAGLDALPGADPHPPAGRAHSSSTLEPTESCRRDYTQESTAASPVCTVPRQCQR